MDLLGNYSDDEDKIVDNELNAIANVPVTLSVQEVKQKKKKRKLDISFLPSHIQEALARGDNSDSDNEVMKSSKIIEQNSDKFPTLLAQLPKPKLDRDYAENVNEVIPTTKLQNIDKFRYDANENSDNDYADDIHSQEITMEPISMSSSLNARIAKDVTVPSSLKEPIPSAPTLLSTLSSAPSILSISSTPGTLHNVPLLPSQPPHFQCQTFTTTLKTQTSEMETEIVSQTQQSYTSNGHFKSSRRRDREIEQELLNGNASVMDPTSTKFVDVHSINQWDVDKYMDSQKRQQELQSIFFSNKSGDKMMSQPTKVQGKRHQINSLAFSAAQSEMELLEAKGNRLKTKHETQSKYGW